MNRRDFTKTLAAICCIPGVKLQDRYIDKWVMADYIDPEPVFSYRELSLYNIPDKVYLKLHYSDGTQERYVLGESNWYRKPSESEIDQEYCYIKDNNFVLHFYGDVITYKNIKRV